MRARSHWRWESGLRRRGADLLVVACAAALSLATLPQLHEHLHRACPGPGHSCAVTLRNAGKCITGIASQAKPLAVRRSPVVRWSKPPTLSPIWVRTLFLEAPVRAWAAGASSERFVLGRRPHAFADECLQRPFQLPRPHRAHCAVTAS